MSEKISLDSSDTAYIFYCLCGASLGWLNWLLG